MSLFVNAKEQLVTESIDGLRRASGNPAIATLDGYPHIKVVCRTDHQPSKVAIISGGGSGHEPSHAGFVGKGMLTAAVCGEVFASPSFDAVLTAILTVTGKAGCLLIVPNYTGDRLNFGLAAERARGLGKKVEMVIVSDDIAIPDIAQPRGIAGVLFVHKIAGYLAEKGASLAVVAAAARSVASKTVTLGISLSSCTLPGAEREDRVPPGQAELGLGIHGEPGVDLIDFHGAKSVAEIICKRLFERVGKASGYALLLNNLGSTTLLEMGVLANEFLTSANGKKIKLIVGPALIVTSLDMHGFSASLLPLTRDYTTALTAPVAPVAWPSPRTPTKLNRLKLPKGMKNNKFKPSSNDSVAAFLSKSCDLLIAMEADLNSLDAKVGDGDTGSTIATGARSLKTHVAQLPLANPSLLLSSISDLLGKSMGGSSGVLLAIMFAAAGQAIKAGDSLTAALQAGLHRMKEIGGARTGDRTMIDALEPALAALASGKSLAKAAAIAREGADATATMTRAGAGRSTYVSSASLKGVPDPGAVAVARLLEGLA
jgi:ATP-dependent dihydroxyacetone kinase